MNYSPSSENGWQLLELLIAVGLCSALLTFPLLSLSEVRAKQQVSLEALKLKQVLEDLSLHCLQTKTKAKVRFGRNSYTVTSLNKLGNIYYLKVPLQIETHPENDREIVFYRDAVHSPGRIKITNGKNSCSLYMSLRGRVRKKCNE